MSIGECGLDEPSDRGESERNQVAAGCVAVKSQQTQRLSGIIERDDPQ